MQVNVRLKRPCSLWRYIAITLIFLILHVLITAIFYTRLPDLLAYHFMADGTPDRWAAKASVVVIGIVLQIIIVMITTGLIIPVSGRLKRQQKEYGINSSKLLMLMGSMPAFLQVIITFVITDIFSYNVYQKHLFSLWVFVIICLLVVTVIFTVFFIFMVRNIFKQSV